MTDKQVNVDLLTTMMPFLHNFDLPFFPEENSHRQTMTDGDDGLLFSSQQLIAETEALLASWVIPTNGNSTMAQDGSSDNHILTEDQLKSKVARIAQRRNKYRLKIKHERETLRRLERDLTAEMQGLQTVRAKSKEENTSNLGYSTWRIVAKRQIEKRSKAEERNRNLKHAVASRSKTIRQIALLLKQHRINDQVKKHLTYGTQASGEEEDGFVVFKAFIYELDSLYAQTDSITRNVNYKFSPSLKYTPTQTQNKGIEYFESADSAVVSFGFEETCNAMSFLLLSSPKKKRHECEINNPENTSAVKYHFEARSEFGDSSTVVIYTIVRRYREPGRLVFVYRGLFEGQGEFDGLHINATSWFVIRSSTGEPNQQSNATVLECFSRSVPNSVNTTPEAQGNMDRFTRVIKELGKNEVKEVVDALATMLIKIP